MQYPAILKLALMVHSTTSLSAGRARLRYDYAVQSEAQGGSRGTRTQSAVSPDISREAPRKGFSF